MKINEKYVSRKSFKYLAINIVLLVVAEMAKSGWFGGAEALMKPLHC